MTYCRDCIHVRLSQNAPNVARYAHCAAAKTEEPVFGAEEMPTCHEARGTHGACGADARLFQLKEKAA